MATATLTQNTDAVLAEIFIAAPPSRVFEAITDLKQRAQWWGKKGLFHVTDSHSDLRPGGKWYEVGSTDDGRPFRVEGEYIEIDPPRLLVHTRSANFAENIPTVVRWSSRLTNCTASMAAARTVSALALWSESVTLDSPAILNKPRVTRTDGARRSAG